jgi:hypothetical protein
MKRTLNMKMETIIVGVLLMYLVVTFFKPVMNLAFEASMSNTNSLINQILE